jgi:hypothetical protein
MEITTVVGLGMILSGLALAGVIIWKSADYRAAQAKANKTLRF